MNRKILSILLFFTVAAFNLYASDAQIISMSGDVDFFSSNAPDWQRARRGQELSAGDRLRTGAGSFAELKFNAGHTTTLDENTSIFIESATEDETGIDMFNGDLRSKVKELSKGQDFSIQTPQAVCAVRGTEFEVSVRDRATAVAVISGRVEATELITGAKVEVTAGHYSTIEPNRKPSPPVEIPGEETIEESASPAAADRMREAAMREMFDEISREAVLARAADEIKRAEYENGKALIDAAGRRVRLEEYVVREKSNEAFKYVVLNHRDNSFDFGQITFMFNTTLPDDLSRVTQTMFYSPERPDWILTDLISVITNTRDRVNEIASGGDMLQDSTGDWRHYFRDYAFSIKGDEREEIELWSRETYPGFEEASYEELTVEYSYPKGEPETVYSYPSGDDAFHVKIRDSYSQDLWLQAEDYLINDSGDIQKTSDISSGLSNYSLRDYLYGLNFERTYTSSEFSDREIDLVFSTKLLMDSGMLDFPAESAGIN